MRLSCWLGFGVISSIVLVSSSLCFAHASFNDSTVSTLCSADSFKNGDQFNINLNTVLETLQKAAAGGQYAVGDDVGSEPDTVFAEVQCSNTLSVSDCGSCVAEAIDKATQMCPLSLGAQLNVTTACAVRYETYAFFSSIASITSPLSWGIASLLTTMTILLILF